MKEDKPKKLEDYEISEDEFLKKIAQHTIPNYVLDNYKYSYISPKMVDFLDNPFMVSIRSLFQSNRLRKEVIKHIKENDKVLCLGNVYGNLLPSIIHKIGAKGSLDLIDVVPYQIEKAANKLKTYNNVDLWLQDASTPIHREYNVILLYFLLSDIPDMLKSSVLKNVFDVMDEFKCKVIVIDYSFPHFLNPLTYLYSFINMFFKPFAKSMWDHNIEDFCRKSHYYKWETKHMLGRVFQATVISPIDDMDET